MYGKITVGYGTSLQKELQIIDFVQAKYKDNRVITVSEIEDGSFTATVENLISTDRNPQSTIWLSKESFMGLLTTAMMYFTIKGEDIQKEVELSLDGKQIDYSFSDNLTEFKP